MKKIVKIRFNSNADQRILFEIRINVDSIPTQNKPHNKGIILFNSSAQKRIKLKT
jgi:hypothetical protein